MGLGFEPVAAYSKTVSGCMGFGLGSGYLRILCLLRARLGFFPGVGASGAASAAWRSRPKTPKTSLRKLLASALDCGSAQRLAKGEGAWG